MDTQVQEAFEATLRESYDDHVTWSIYADWLIEQGDPRGELMQVQLALEDETLPWLERKRLEKQEENLLHTYMEEFLGDLAPFLVELSEIEVDERVSVPTFRRNPNYKFEFRRGFLTDLRIRNLQVEFAEKLSVSTLARFLQCLTIDGNGIFDPTSFFPRFADDIRELQQATFWEQLKSLSLHTRVGRPDEFDAIATLEVLKRCQQLQALVIDDCRMPIDQILQMSLPNLEELTITRSQQHGNLEQLANNPSMARLKKVHLLGDPERQSATHETRQQLWTLAESPYLDQLVDLRIDHSTCSNDEFIAWAYTSNLQNLRVLELADSRITNAGIRRFLDSPRANQLDDVLLSGRGITLEGRNLLWNWFPKK